MERKYLYVDYLTCIGCETCQTVCEFIHGGNPYMRIYTLPRTSSTYLSPASTATTPPV
jgi:ferredoxin